MLKITGLEELTRKLDDLAESANDLHGTHSVPVGEMLTPDFVHAHTRFANVDEFFDASGFKVDSTEDFEAIPTEELDKFVRSVSSFESWQAMAAEAAKAWAAKKLGF